MANMPNRWAGAGAALGAAVLFAFLGFYAGSAGGEKLAFGFTFDWYEHPVEPSYPAEDALFWAGNAANVAAFLTIALVGAPTAFLTWWRMRALRYAPPRYSEAAPLDLHVGRLLLHVPFGLSVLSLLTAYVLLSSPYLLVWLGLTDSGEVLERVSPIGYQTLVAAGAAAGAGIAAGLTVWLTFYGVVRGHVIRKGDHNLIARISLFGVKNAKTTIALVLAVTAVAGYFAATGVSTNVDVADVLPRGDPNTDAAHNLTDKFKSSFTQQVTFQFHVIDVNNSTQMEAYAAENARKLPYRVTTPDPGNISDELYVRAIDEAIRYITLQEPFAGSVGTPDFYKLINWTVAGGATDQNRAGRAAFALPPTDREGEIAYASVEQGVNRVSAVYNAVDAVTSPSWRQTAVLVTVDPRDDVLSKIIGERALEVRQQYVDDVESDPAMYQVFGAENPPQFTVDLPIANAHASELTQHDFKLLMPIIGAFVAVTLFIAFRNAVSVLVTFSSLSVAVVWTFGAMGAMEIPLNTLNLAVVPLIMGVGIDYGIHMMNEYQEYRAKGKTMEQAWALAGGGSALALFVGALTTSAGLFVMVISPSLLVAQLGILGNIALASCYILSILFIPALVTVMGGGHRRARAQKYEPSRLMPMIAHVVSRGRIIAVVLVLLLAGAAVASQSNLRREAFGDPPRNWLEDDPLRKEHEEALKAFYDSEDPTIKANIIIIEGDVTDPAVHRYIMGITATLRQNAMAGEYFDPITNETRESRVIADTLRDLPFLMNTYLTVKDGVPGVGQFLGADALARQFAARNFTDPSGQTQTYPQTQQETKDLMDEVFAGPLAQFGNLFVDPPDYEMTVIVFSVNAATYDDAESVWGEVAAAIQANEALRPEGTKTSFFGNTAINYLFVAKQVPWLNAMNLVAVSLVVLIVFGFTRSLRATLVVGLISGLASTMWFGLLPTLDIGLAINLTLPLIFISAMGSDYGLHLAMRCQRTKNTHETMESVGKGVLFSFITTMGAFLIFTQISDLAGRRSIIGTCLAISVVFLMTLLIVPIVFPTKKDAHTGGRSVPVVEARPVTPATVKVVPAGRHP